MMRSRWLAILALPAVIGAAIAQTGPPDAAKLFAERCAACHGDGASGADRGPPLSRSRRLRTRSTSEIRDIIQKGTPAGMPPFPLPEDQLQALSAFVRSMNATAFDARPEGDAAAGERFYFGKGRCASCHTAMGRGKAVGPDLTSIGLQLQTLDGRLILLADGEFEITGRDKTSAMPPLQATAAEERDLYAFLSGLSGLPAGALPAIRAKLGEHTTLSGVPAAA